MKILSIRYSSSKRLQAKQCLVHPWLTRRPKLASTPKDDEAAQKKLSTKKLRRFVIRRRWQVRSFASKFSISMLLFFLESGQCFISIKTYGNDVMKIATTQFSSSFFYSINQYSIFYSSRVSFTKNKTLLFLFFFFFSLLLPVVRFNLFAQRIECVSVSE